MQRVLRGKVQNSEGPPIRANPGLLNINILPHSAPLCPAISTEIFTYKSEMVDCKKRKGTISEEDMALVLQRYSAKSILTLLQEIAQFKFNDTKIDWSEVANKQSIGITCPRECQMLWRHLAYRHPLQEKLEEGAIPLDDDSDLEFVVEPSPTISGEISSEAFAYVKVLMSSGLNNDSSPTNHPPVEAPLTINIPDMQLPLQKDDTHTPTQGQNIRVPVFVQKHALPAVLPVENLDGNGTSCSNQPARKKRKGWNKCDEKKLLEAIQKHGIGNWQDLEKEDFRVPRTASEIHQKWIHMKTKNTGTSVNYKRTTTTEDQMLMRQAISMALDRPSNRSSSAPCSGGTTSNSISSSIFSTTIPETASFNVQKVPNQSQQTLSQAIPQKIGSSLLNKPRTAQVRAPITMTPRTGSNTMIQKAAIAAGGRIAPAETAASLFKAAQSKNVFHIRPGGTISVSAAPTKPPPSTLAVGTHPSVTAQTLSSPPVLVSSGMVSSVSGAGSQVAKCSFAKSILQPTTQSFSVLSCKQPLEKPKQTVCISSSTLGNVDGTACSLPKGGSMAPTTICSASTANQNQMSVVDLGKDEVDSSADAVDKGNTTVKNRQQSSEMTGSAFKSSFAVSGLDKALQTKTCEMRRISLQNLSQCTDSQEDKKSKHSVVVDGYHSLDGDGKGKAVVSLETKPNEGSSQASSTQDAVDGQDKNASPTSCVPTSVDVETSKVPVTEDSSSTEKGGRCLGNVPEELVTPAGTANDSPRQDGMICTTSTSSEDIRSAVQNQSG